MDIICGICPRRCTIAENDTGYCNARRNSNGVNVPIFYGRISSIALDPIEKKPLYEFYPGTRILSVGFWGCNMHCAFCQNYSISQIAEGNNVHMENKECSPLRLRDIAIGERKNGNIGIAYTYNEPLTNYEYVRDTAKLVRQSGMKNVLVTNGNADIRILEELLPFIDAMNIDLKTFRPEKYQGLGGDLETVKSFIAAAAEKIHVEVTSLIVPEMNDSIADMEREAEWLSELEKRYKKRIPLHITRFFPQYKMTSLLPTNIELMKELKKIANKYLEAVYLGNV